MRKIIAATFVSLDGVMQAPGGPDEDPAGGFKLGGWTVPYWDDVMGGVMAEVFEKPYATSARSQDLRHLCRLLA